MDIDDEVRAREALRAAQAKLSRSSRLASLAELSASVAHEVNQPLAAVITNSHACQRWLSADPPNLERARITTERIIRDAIGAAEVVSRIRALFKQAASVKTSININEVVREIRLLMIDEMTSQGVVLETELDPALPSVSADRVQIQQVLVNLIRNGVDAMKSNADVRKSLFVRTRGDEQGRILTEVRDTGPGISDRRASSSLSSRRKATAWAWDWRFAGPSWSRTMAPFGPRASLRGGPRSRLRSRFNRATSDDPSGLHCFHCRRR